MPTVNDVVIVIGAVIRLRMGVAVRMDETVMPMGMHMRNTMLAQCLVPMRPRPGIQGDGDHAAADQDGVGSNHWN